MRVPILTAGAIALAAFSISCSTDFPTVSLSTVREMFAAPLSPASEVPPVTSSATGSTSFVFMDSSTIRVEVKVSAIDSVTQAHIHAGSPGANGPVMVFLYGPATTNQQTLNGVLRQLDITRASTFSTPFTFDSVATRIRAGTAYVNVHTRKNPGGEIRGQVARQ